MEKLRFSRVVDKLKEDKTIFSDVERYMLAEQYIAPIEIRKSTPVKAQLAITDGTDVGDQKGNLVDDSDPDARPDDHAIFNRNINKFKDIIFETYARALKKCEPSIFTDGNLKTMRKRGAAKVAIDDMLKLLEFLTDIDPEDTIDQSCRTKMKVVNLVVTTYENKGRRGRGLIMPITYDNQGPYQLNIKLGEAVVEVLLKWTGKTITIEVPRAAHVYLDMAHSTLKCKLRAQGSTFVKPLWPLFCRLTAAEETIETGGKVLNDQIAKVADSNRKRLRVNGKAPAHAIADSPLIIGTTGGINSPHKTKENFASYIEPQVAQLNTKIGNLGMKAASSNATPAEAYGLTEFGKVDAIFGTDDATAVKATATIRPPKIQNSFESFDIRNSFGLV